jgi:hypothetical protein
MRSEGSEPLLSVVVTTRNDNHGGDLNRRTQLFIDGLAAQAERHRVSVELVVVEWNPPDERPSIADALQWPTDTEHFDARVIVVPGSLHRRLKHSERLPLFQMIAKNVGIRRARGRFVVATNVDVLFSHQLMDHIAREQLSERALYRVDRYDIESDVPDGVPFDDCLVWCDAHVLRICKREGTFDLREDHFYRIYESMRVPLWFAGYVRIWRYLWRRVCLAAKLMRRVAQSCALVVLSPIRSTTFSLTAKVLAATRSPARFLARLRRGVPDHVPSRKGVAQRLELWSTRMAARLQARATAERIALARRRKREARRRAARPSRVLTPAIVIRKALEQLAEDWTLIRGAIVGERARLRLHTNACGDFTLMSRAAWEKVGGYPELELFSMHIDSILLYQAHYTGIHEAFLPHRLYHIEHADGFRPDPEALGDLNKRLEENAIPQISGVEFLEDVVEMYRTSRPKFQNPESWGFSTETLEDRRVVKPLSRSEPALHRGSRVGV